MKRLLEWLLSFFSTKEEKVLNQKIEDIDNKLEEIDSENDVNAAIDRINNK